MFLFCYLGGLMGICLRGLQRKQFICAVTYLQFIPFYENKMSHLYFHVNVCFRIDAREFHR